MPATIVNIKNIDIGQMTQFFAKKDLCFEKVPDADVYVSQDISPEDASKQFAAMSWAELSSYTQENNNLYEIIKEDRPRYSYFDIDATYQKVKHTLKDIDDFGEMIQQNLQLMIEDFKADNGIDEVCDIVVLEACTKNKFSYHFIDRSISFANKDDCKVYHEKLLDHLYAKNESLLTSIIDKVVYDKDRNFRLVNQSKMKKGAVPLSLKSSHTFEETYITRVDDATRYVIPKQWLRKKHREVIAPIVEHLEDNETEELLLIIDNLKDERFIEYDLWLKTVWALHACGLSVDDIHYISGSRCPEKYDYLSTEGVIKQYDHGKSKFSAETLKSWARTDTGFEIDRVVDRKRQEQPKKREEHYTYTELLYEYGGRVFTDKSGFNEFKKKVSLCLNHIVGTDDEFIMYKNQKNQYHLTKKPDKLLLHFHDTATDKTFVVPLRQYIIDNRIEFPMFNDIVFKPNDHELRPREFNTWAGFRAQEVADVDYDLVKVFTNHIRDVWANGNEVHYKYLMSWIAQVIKTPEKKTDIAILLQGGQGSGKTLPCDILLERVFGRNIGLSSSGLGSLTQRFNGATMSKIFCKVDELSVVDGDSFNACFDKMKSLITDRHIQIEKKGMEHIMIDNHINFIMTTNHRHTVKIEGDDRRYACFAVSDQYKQNNNYFADFMDVLDNDEAGDHIYTYFKRYPNEDMVNLRRIPMTEIKEEMLESSKSSVQKFVECMDEEIEPAILYDWVGKDGQNAISGSNFYAQYKGWCCANGEKAWKNTSVGIELRNQKLYREKDRKNRNGVTRCYYQF